MIFGNLFERRDSLENPSVSLTQALTLMDEPSASGLSLSPEKMAQVPDVFACVQVLSQDVAKAPVKLRQVRTYGQHEDAEGNVLWEILRELANPETTAYQLRYDMQRDLLTYTKAYAEIVRTPDGEVSQLWKLDPRYMKVTRNPLLQKVWTYTAPGQRPITWTFHPSKPPIFELSHESPINRCRDLIALAAALELFASKFFANAARVSGVLEVPPGFSENARNNLRDSFSALYQSVRNAYKVPLLEAGAVFKPVSNTNDEAQFNETRKFIRTLIAGVLRVPPHKIGDLERATFANIEHQSIDYVSSALDPYFVCWEQAIKRDLLSTKQFSRYQVVFDRDALIQGDLKSRLDAFAVGRQNGIWSGDDIRRKLNENPIGKDGAGDAYLINGNMVPVAEAVKLKAAPQPASAPPQDSPADPAAGQ